MKFLAILFLSSLIYSCSNGEVVQEDEEVKPNIPARLLVDKRILNDYLVENQNINIKYSIYNVGGNTAQNIELNDNSLPLSYFDKLNGTDSIKVANLLPNGKVEQILVYKPKIGVHGRVNFTSAEVYYRSEGLSTVLSTQSSEPGVGFILSVEDYEKRFSLHLFEWGIFAALSLFSIVIPYSLYSSSKRKYQNIKNKSK